MGGHVRKRGTSWAVVVDVGRHPQAGRRRQKWYSGFRTRKGAEQALAESLGRLGRGEYVAPSCVTVGAFFDQWLASMEARVRPSTYESYTRNLRVHVRPTLGEVALQGLGPVHLNELYSRLLCDGRANGKGGLAPRTVRYIHVILHRALRDDVRWGLLVRSPADLADPPSASSARPPEMKIWTVQQLQTFLAHTAERRLHAAFLLAATTGMRRGEVAGLKWADLDSEGGRLAVRRSLTTAGYQVNWSQPKTDRSRRSVALDPATLEALRAHRARQAKEKLALGPAYNDQNLVFAREDGLPLHPERLSKLLGRSVKAGGPSADPLPRPPPHPRDSRPPGRRAPQDRQRAPRPRRGRDHLERLQPRDAGPRGAGRDPYRGPGLRRLTRTSWRDGRAPAERRLRRASLFGRPASAVVGGPTARGSGVLIGSQSRVRPSRKATAHLRPSEFHSADDIRGHANAACRGEAHGRGHPPFRDYRG